MVAGIQLFSMPSFLPQNLGFDDSNIGDSDHIIHLSTVAPVD